MSRKKLSRVQIHKRICEAVGITTKSCIGYLSRKEMLDVLTYLECPKTNTSEEKAGSNDAKKSN